MLCVRGLLNPWLQHFPANSETFFECGTFCVMASTHARCRKRRMETAKLERGTLACSKFVPVVQFFVESAVAMELSCTPCLCNCVGRRFRWTWRVVENCVLGRSMLWNCYFDGLFILLDLLVLKIAGSFYSVRKPSTTHYVFYFTEVAQNLFST